MAESHVVSALVAKRAEIAGVIARAEQQLGQFRADCQIQSTRGVHDPMDASAANFGAESPLRRRTPLGARAIAFSRRWPKAPQHHSVRFP